MENAPHDIYNAMNERSVGRMVNASSVEADKLANRYVRTTREYIQENPVRTVAIAALTSGVVGSVLTMIMRRHK